MQGKGRLRWPVARALLMRSSAQRCRCRSAGCAIGLSLVLVAKWVSRRPSASVKRNWVPRYGRSSRTISRMPFGRPVRQSPWSLATQAPSRISPPGSMGHPGGGRQCRHRPVNLFGDGHTDRVGRPSALLREPFDARVGASAELRADQRLPRHLFEAIAPPRLPRDSCVCRRTPADTSAIGNRGILYGRSHVFMRAGHRRGQQRGGWTWQGTREGAGTAGFSRRRSG